MALTVSSPFFAELARKKAQQDLLRQQMVQASGQAMGAVDGFGKTQEAQKEQALRLKQQETENARAHTEQGLRLREFEERAEQNRIGNERNATLDAQDVEALRLKQGVAAREAMDARDAAAAKARADEEASGRAEAERQAKLILAGVDNMEAEEGAAALDRVRALGFSDEEINEFRTLAMREQAARDLARRAAEAKIGQAERANRPKVGAGAGGMTDKQRADLDLARMRASAAGEAATDRQRKRDEADRKTLGELQEAEKAIWEMDMIEKDSGKYNTGPLMDPVQDFAGKVLPEAVFNPAERNAWKAKVARRYNAILKEESGAAVTASEETRQLVAQLNTKLDDATFDAVLKDIRISYARDLANARARLTPTSRTRAAVEQDPGTAGAPGSADAEAAWGGDF